MNRIPVAAGACVLGLVLLVAAGHGRADPGAASPQPGSPAAPPSGAGAGVARAGATGAAAGSGAAAAAGAGEPTPPPNEDLLGTVEVNGSVGLPPLPTLGLIPILTTGTADGIVNLVSRRDLELSGQFDVLDENASPAGPFTHTTAPDLAAWRGRGAEYVVRVFAQPAPNDSIKTELVADAYLTPSPAQAAAQKAHLASLGDAAPAPPDPKPAFHTVVPTATTEVRA
ncbi:MAG: hypothetical protein JOZ69_17135, partial [Myxococcales bacterium]|nr:hypothetical protein [Myxococcales bacterium]